MPILDAVLYRKPPEFRRAGIIRLGVKVAAGLKDGKPIMRPSEVDYFVLPPDLRERHAELKLDEKPKELVVAFPVDDIAQIYPMHIQAYGGKFLTFRCDGETATAFGKDGAELTERCRMTAAGECVCADKPINAKALGRLNVIVATAKHTDVYQVLIGGLRRNGNLLAEIRKNQAILRHAGLGLSGCWFKLTREARDVQIKTADGGRTIQHGYPVHCILEVEPMQVMGRMLGAPVAPRQLKAHEADSGASHPDNIPQSPESVRTGEGPSSAREPDRGSSANEPPKAGDEPARELFCSQCNGPRPCPLHDASPDGELDFSLCLAKAVPLLGLRPGQYDAYACLAFGVERADDLSSHALGELMAALEIAARNDQAKTVLRQTVMLTLNKRGGTTQ